MALLDRVGQDRRRIAVLAIVVIAGFAVGIGFSFLLVSSQNPGTGIPAGPEELIFAKPNISYLNFMDDWVLENGNVSYPSDSRVLTADGHRSLLLDGRADAGIVGPTQLPVLLTSIDDLVVVAGIRFPPRMGGVYGAPGVDSMSDLDDGKVAIPPFMIGYFTELVLSDPANNVTYERVNFTSFDEAERLLQDGEVDGAVLLQQPGPEYGPVFYPQEEIEELYGTRAFQSFIVSKRDHASFAWEMAETINRTYIVAESNIDEITTAYTEETGRNMTLFLRENAKSRVFPATRASLRAHTEIIDRLHELERVPVIANLSAAFIADPANQ